MARTAADAHSLTKTRLLHMMLGFEAAPVAKSLTMAKLNFHGLFPLDARFLSARYPPSVSAGTSHPEHVSALALFLRIPQHWYHQSLSHIARPSVAVLSSAAASVCRSCTMRKTSLIWSFVPGIELKILASGGSFLHWQTDAFHRCNGYQIPKMEPRIALSPFSIL